MAVRCRWQRRELQPQLHREVQPPYQQVGSSLVHVHTPEQRRGGCAGTPQLPTPFLAHPVGVFDEPLTKNQDLPYLKGTGVCGGALGSPHGAAGRYKEESEGTGLQPQHSLNPGAMPVLGAHIRSARPQQLEMCFLDEHPPCRGQEERMLSALFRLISPLTQRG